VDRSIQIGAVAGALAYACWKRVIDHHWGEVVIVSCVNFCFSICLSLLVIGGVCRATGVPRDQGLLLAVSFVLSFSCQWWLNEMSPNIGKRLLSRSALDSLREWLISLLSKK